MGERCQWQNDMGVSGVIYSFSHVYIRYARDRDTVIPFAVRIYQSKRTEGPINLLLRDFCSRSSLWCLVTVTAHYYATVR